MGSRRVIYYSRNYFRKARDGRVTERKLMLPSSAYCDKELSSPRIGVVVNQPLPPSVS